MTQNRVNRHGIDDKDVFTGALKTTVPVFLGYIPLGMAFGFLLDGAGYHWIYAFLMSLLVYAGSGQFLAVALLAAGGAGLTEFVIATLLLNLRHAFYGLSLLENFRRRESQALPYICINGRDLCTSDHDRSP